MAYILTDTVPW